MIAYTIDEMRIPFRAVVMEQDKERQVLLFLHIHTVVHRLPHILKNLMYIILIANKAAYPICIRMQVVLLLLAAYWEFEYVGGFTTAVPSFIGTVKTIVIHLNERVEGSTCLISKTSLI